METLKLESPNNYVKQVLHFLMASALIPCAAECALTYNNIQYATYNNIQYK